jgi:hypothetical protein
MSQFIYISKFPASPEATKRQQFHFAADINFAYSEEYSFIKSSDNMTFQIVSPTELVEVDVTEEQLQAAADNMQSLTEEPSIFEEEDYCINCHNIMLIDQIINNTLLQEGQLSTDSCDNMLKLAHLKQMLGDC